ncbi:MAG: hypothetical protein EXS32_15495 [Opitutus sp.]|nr:hypothetical protein [Opitutus sp.]
MRHRLAFAAAILLGIAAYYFLRPKVGRVIPNAPLSPLSSASAPRPLLENQPPKTEKSSAPASPIADELNAPAGTIRGDLALLNELFVTFQTNFPRTGNPVGENAEITAALTGDNPVKFSFLSPRHRAINARGELCDRWGTPFRFHQVSGTQMEIRSAGPDKKFGTGDDASWPPAP